MSGPAAGPSLAVVIPTRDRAGAVERLVRRLLAAPAAPDEVVVVDDGSTDGTAAAVEAIGPPVLLVPGEGRGPAAARNRGAAAATSTWVAFLDDDDEPDEGWCGALRALAARPGVGHVSVGHRRRYGAATTEHPVEVLGPAFGDHRASLFAGTFALRRDGFEAVGGFDEQLRHMELTDLALRWFAWADGAGVGSAADPAPRITIVARPPTERASQDPEVLVRCARRVLERSADLWARDPAGLADQLATVGVAEVRAGRVGEGRRLLLRAARLQPRSRQHLARAAVSLVGPLARRAWPPWHRPT